MTQRSEKTMRVSVTFVVVVVAVSKPVPFPAIQPD
jgi:hypothetical protein